MRAKEFVDCGREIKANRFRLLIAFPMNTALSEVSEGRGPFIADRGLNTPKSSLSLSHYFIYPRDSASHPIRTANALRRDHLRGESQGVLGYGSVRPLAKSFKSGAYYAAPATIPMSYPFGFLSPLRQYMPIVCVPKQ